MLKKDKNKNNDGGVSKGHKTQLKEISVNLEQFEQQNKVLLC